jgi:hypothetical protein
LLARLHDSHAFKPGRPGLVEDRRIAVAGHAYQIAGVQGTDEHPDEDLARARLRHHVVGIQAEHSGRIAMTIKNH